jgi:Acyl-CoA dehydrogenase, N-terminal domain
MEEFARVGAASLQSGVSVHEDIVLPYLLDLADEEQKQRCCPAWRRAQRSRRSR